MTKETRKGEIPFTDRFISNFFNLLTKEQYDEMSEDDLQLIGETFAKVAFAETLIRLSAQVAASNYADCADKIDNEKIMSS